MKFISLDAGDSLDVDYSVAEGKKAEVTQSRQSNEAAMRRKALL